MTSPTRTFTSTRVAALVTALTIGAAEAATISFDDLEYIDDDGVYVENGVTVTAIGGDLGGGPGVAHVDDAYFFAPSLSFTMAQPFDAVSLTLTSLGYDFLRTPERLRDNIFITGFSGGSVVAEASYALSDVYLMVQNIVLGDAFLGLDSLLVELRYVYGWEVCDSSPCAHFELNEVTLASVTPAAVPLPASAAGLGAALLGLFGLGWRARAVKRRA